MTPTSPTAVYYDPYDVDIDDDPYPTWTRLRDKAPLYRNETLAFYAPSRWDDVKPALRDWETYRSGRGTVLEIISAGVEIPPGVLLFEDPPLMVPRIATSATSRTLIDLTFTATRGRTSPSDTDSTSVSVLRWLAWKGESLWRRSCGAGRRGMSTSTEARWPTPPVCGGGYLPVRPERRASHERSHRERE